MNVPAGTSDPLPAKAPQQSEHGTTTAAGRLLLCLGTVPLPDGLRHHLIDAGWTLVSVADLHLATRALQNQRHGLGLLFIEHWTAEQCDALRVLLHTHNHCEWVGVFSADAQQVAGCSDLILGYLFDHHTLPVDPPHLLRTLGHAHGRYALRQQVLQGLMPVDPAIARSGAPLNPTTTTSTVRVPATQINRKPCNSGADAKPSSQMLGQSPLIKTLMRQIRKVAATDVPVLIGGESGSGKEVTAHAIHQQSQRCAGPFILVNCGTLPVSLIQAELFGATRGAYTGAVRDRKGLLEAANGGTIFLDEIADLPLDMQTNLLRFLQEKTITPVGSSVSVRVDVRVLAASNTDLEVAVQQGRFRHDLFYRLNVVPITVPPLRERREDIVLLALHFFECHAADRTSRLCGFSASALRAMLSHDWPGNVREMINRVRRALVMSDGRLIRPHDLGLVEAGTSVDPVNRIRLDAERAAVSAALARSHRNITHAARELGVSRMTLYRMIERHQLDLVELRAVTDAVPTTSSEKIRTAKV